MEIFLKIVLGFVILYIAAKLVFWAWWTVKKSFKEKEEFKKGGKKNAKK